MKDFLGFEIFDFGIFLGRKILRGIFQFGKLDLSRDFLGIQNNPKIRDSFIICCFLEILVA